MADVTQKAAQDNPVKRATVKASEGDTNENSDKEQPQTAEQKLTKFLIKQIVRVSSGEVQMFEAKRDLTFFWNSLSRAERQELYNGNKGVAVANKVKLLAESLVNDIPMLLGQFSRGE